MHFETRAIRVGQEPDPATGAIIPPIYATSNFQRRSIDQQDGYAYSRVSNPTRTAAEQCLAALENARYGLLFASGMAAEVALLGTAASRRPCGLHARCVRRHNLDVEAPRAAAGHQRLVCEYA
jgi:cystathionine beta-lyase/cystathionine gamma-synthase